MVGNFQKGWATLKRCTHQENKAGLGVASEHSKYETATDLGHLRSSAGNGWGKKTTMTKR
jgi:hypothetical protein